MSSCSCLKIDRILYCTIPAVSQPRPAHAAVTYRDVLDFDEETLRRVLRAGNFSTDGTTDDLRQRVLRVLRLESTEKPQIGTVDSIVADGDKAKGGRKVDQIQEAAKSLKLPKETPNPGKVKVSKT